MKKTLLYTLSTFAALSAFADGAYNSDGVYVNDLTAGTHTDFYGAGQNYVGGDIVVNIHNSDAVFSDRFHGGVDLPAAFAKGDTLKTVDGNITYNISTGDFTSPIVNAGYYVTKDTVTFGEKTYTSIKDVVMNISGGDFYRIQGGHTVDSSAALALKEKGIVASVGSVTMNISGGTVSSVVRGAGGAHSSVRGLVQVNISGNAQLNCSVYAGGRDEKGVGVSVGSTNVNVSGGTITGSVYGGGTFDAYSTTVKGDTLVKISGGTISKNVYGGGEQDIVKGNTRVELSGGKIGGIVYGGGTAGSVVEGTKTLDVVSYEHTLNAQNFDVVNVGENANVTFKSFNTDVNGTVLNVKGNISVADASNTITISEGGSLNLTLKASNQIDASVTNNGTFSVTAKSNLAAGSQFSIISGTLTGNAIKAYGGVVNGNIFTVGEVKNVEINKEAQGVVVANNGIVTVKDSAAPEVEAPVVEMAFNASEVTVNKVETVVATESFKETLASDVEFDVAQAFEFDVDGMKTGDSVVLSFYIGDSSLTAKDFTIFHKGDGESDAWGAAEDVSDVAYDGTTLSFVVTHFSSYGFTALSSTVPEPAEWAAIFGAIALGLAIYRRRK